MSKKEAARIHGIPRSTLRRKLKHDKPQKAKRGPGPLMGAEESKIVNWVKEMARIGFPVNCGLLLETGRRMSKVARSLGVGKISSAEK